VCDRPYSGIVYLVPTSVGTNELTKTVLILPEPDDNYVIRP